MGLATKIKAVVYFIDWQSNNAILQTSKEKLSCIIYNDKIYDILCNIFNKISKYGKFIEVYQSLFEEQIEKFNGNEINKLKANFTNSTRFQWKNKNLIVKINRFGHAMDPDRGILYFANMLFGGENITTKFIIKRKNLSGKESYKTLFDGLSSNIINKLYDIVKNNIDSKIALEIFQIITNANLQYKQIDSKNYVITNLKEFLNSYSNNTYKSIFLNSSKLQFCDYDNNIICEISWDFNLVKNYLNNLNSNLNNTPSNITPLIFDNAKEDIITYASVYLLKKVSCDVLAISYPGAQGDKAILIGQGRQTKRIYLDIIATKNSTKCFVLLQENKEKYSDLGQDSLKLNGLKRNNIDSLNTLLNKINFHTIKQDNIYLGLGSKYSKNSQNFSIFDVDYIFSFDIKSDLIHTTILWNIAIINFDLCDIFSPLLNQENKLQGIIKLQTIYKS